MIYELKGKIIQKIIKILKEVFFIVKYLIRGYGKGYKRWKYLIILKFGLFGNY